MKANSHHTVQPENRIAQPSAVLAEMIRDGSNYEHEWLWAAQRVDDLQEKQYCLQRALYINPQSIDARRQLRAIEGTRSTRRNANA
jgi:hypothetical protein